jgi:heterogeneous nuclear ribonucleoprotein R
MAESEDLVDPDLMEEPAADEEATAREEATSPTDAATATDPASPASARRADEDSDDEDASVLIVDPSDDLLKKPAHSCELFLGGIPKSASEADVRAFCDDGAEGVASPSSVQLVIDTATGQNRGYAFVAYPSREDAAAAAEKLNEKAIEDKKIRVSVKQTKHRVFIGNVDRMKTRAEVIQGLRDAGCGGVEKLEMPKNRNPAYPSQTKGFGFADFYNASCAERAMKILSESRLFLGRPVTARWADPKLPDPSTTVKSVYVGNLPPSLVADEGGEEKLKALFGKYGDVETVFVYKPRPGDASASAKRNFAFVHYASRESALAAAEAGKRSDDADATPSAPIEIDGCALDVTMAKPMKDQGRAAAGGGGRGGGGRGGRARGGTRATAAPGHRARDPPAVRGEPARGVAQDARAVLPVAPQRRRARRDGRVVSGLRGDSVGRARSAAKGRV